MESKSAFVPDLQGSSLFTPWKDPQSGITSYLLDKPIAPLLQTFYFTSASFSRDGRYYWFYCAFPPAGNANQGRMLGVIDFFENRADFFPETAFTDASPMVDDVTGEAYWCSGLEVWKRGPRPNDQAVLVNAFPSDLAFNRRPWRLATHLTMSADRKCVNIDAEFSNEWFVGQLPLNGGPLDIWQKFDRCYNHSLFNPVDPHLQVMCQSESFHPVTGKQLTHDNHLWYIRKGEEAKPIYPDPLPCEKPEVVCTSAHGELGTPDHVITDSRKGLHGHHFWSPDGQYVWYCHYHTGVERVRLGTSTPELMWPHKTVSHARISTTGKWLVLDSLPPEDPQDRHVTFVNLETKKTVHIISSFPDMSASIRKYHIHPHPQFVLSDQFITYTTTVRNKVDVALLPVGELVQRTS